MVQDGITVVWCVRSSMSMVCMFFYTCALVSIRYEAWCERRGVRYDGYRVWDMTDGCRVSTCSMCRSWFRMV